MIRASQNNFDLIRLLAASQVAVYHTIDVMNHPASESLAMKILGLFPGVPIFFFISGFLISRSYERSHQVYDYARNRVLRVFPALHVCVFLNLLLVAMTGYFDVHDVSLSQLLALYIAKTTFAQFYNPDFMRSFGDGVLNGSLWTICVELQFYLLVPVIYSVRARLNDDRAFSLFLFALALASVFINRALYGSQVQIGDSLGWKFLRVSFLPWFYMFLVGVLVQRHFEVITTVMQKNGLLMFVILIYPIIAWIMRSGGMRFDNGMPPLVFFALSVLTLAMAYARIPFPSILGKNDISYGVYIYHMVVVNMFVYYGLKYSIGYVMLALLISYLLAVLSWLLVERPAMSLKRGAYRHI